MCWEHINEHCLYNTQLLGGSSNPMLVTALPFLVLYMCNFKLSERKNSIMSKEYLYETMMALFETYLKRPYMLWLRITKITEG